MLTFHSSSPLVSSVPVNINYNIIYIYFFFYLLVSHVEPLVKECKMWNIKFKFLFFLIVLSFGFCIFPLFFRYIMSDFFFFLIGESPTNIFFVHNPVNYFKYLSLFLGLSKWGRKEGRNRGREVPEESAWWRKSLTLPFLHPCEFDAYRVALVNVYKKKKFLSAAYITEKEDIE